MAMYAICVIECDYFGTTYVYGQIFVANDGCSRCYCGAEGQVTCDNTPCRKFNIRAPLYRERIRFDQYFLFNRIHST